MSRALAWAVVALLLSVAGAGTGPVRWTEADTPARLFATTPVLAEPAEAAAFMAAYARGDVATLDRLGSPLYRLEAGRKSADPLAPFPWAAVNGVAATPAPRFAYVDGLVDGAGYVHLLYVSTPAGAAEDDPVVAVWRADLAPDRRVVWVEMVRMFWRVTRLAPVRTTAIGPTLLTALPAARAVVGCAGLRPRTIVGVEAPDGQGYYLVAVDRGGDAALAALGPARATTTLVAHFSVDPGGGVVEGAWTYGGPVVRHVGDDPVLMHRRIPPELLSEERAYLATLCP